MRNVTSNGCPHPPACPARLRDVQAMAAPHMSREGTVKLLEALKGAKIKRVADLRSAEIATALTEVVAKVRRETRDRQRQTDRENKQSRAEQSSSGCLFVLYSVLYFSSYSFVLFCGIISCPILFYVK